MYAGSGNKITIKRKAAATDETEILQTETDGGAQSSVGSLKCIPSSHLTYGATSPKKSSKSGKVIINYERFERNFYSLAPFHSPRATLKNHAQVLRGVKEKDVDVVTLLLYRAN